MKKNKMTQFRIENIKMWITMYEHLYKICFFQRNRATLSYHAHKRENEFLLTENANECEMWSPLYIFETPGKTPSNVISWLLNAYLHRKWEFWTTLSHYGVVYENNKFVPFTDYQFN